MAYVTNGNDNTVSIVKKKKVLVSYDEKSRLQPIEMKTTTNPFTLKTEIKMKDFPSTVVSSGYPGTMWRKVVTSKPLIDTETPASTTSLIKNSQGCYGKFWRKVEDSKQQINTQSISIPPIGSAISSNNYITQHLTSTTMNIETPLTKTSTLKKEFN